MRATFLAFAGQHAMKGPGSKSVPEMDGPKFAKLCRNSNLVHGKLTSTGVDLVFSKVKAQVRRRLQLWDLHFIAEPRTLQQGPGQMLHPGAHRAIPTGAMRVQSWWGPEPAAWLQGARRISWGEFERALALLAAEKDAQVEAVQQAVAGCLGPSHGGPGAGNHVRLHDSRVQTGTQPKLWLCPCQELLPVAETCSWTIGLCCTQRLCCCAGRPGRPGAQTARDSASSLSGSSSVRASPMR